MTNNEKAFKEAEKEIAKERVEEIKELMKSILQKIQDYQDQKSEAEEAIRLLKLDLEDLRAGKLDKIRQRHEQSKKSVAYSRGIDFAPILNATVGYCSPAISVSNAVSNSIGWESCTTASTSGSLYVSGTASIPWDTATSGTFMVQRADGTTREMFL